MHLPFAAWLGHLLTVRTPLPMTSRPQGLVLHISDGTLGRNGAKGIPNLLGLAATFNASDFPAHFGVSSEGTIAQYIDTARQDRATERGANWFSVECCAFRGDALTDSQVSGVAFLLALLRETFQSFPLALADSPAASGLAYHSLFLTAAELQNPKKHSHCPGALVVAQRSLIVERARTIFGP